ncbi:hypothetical protein [Ensifer sp. BR816]|uniref:hypothetical protein n=1 Tax=Rhizobium sp. (strain BR816) TaxID=1057002 RepID=UPI0003670C20|nr:hypothetical protein [Ensifer sp. BR816]
MMKALCPIIDGEILNSEPQTAKSLEIALPVILLVDGMPPLKEQGDTRSSVPIFSL